MRKSKLLILLFVVIIVASACGALNNADVNLQTAPANASEIIATVSPDLAVTPTVSPQQNEIRPTDEPDEPTSEVYDNLENDPLPSPSPSPTAYSNLYVYFIDVGQADSILIEIDNEAMLIDAGNNNDADTVINFIQSRGIADLKYVIGTHPHEDHIGGLDAVLTAFNINTVIMPKAQANTQTFEDVLDALILKGLTITTPVPEAKYSLGDASFTILAPNNDSYNDLNNYSVVIRLTYGETSFLFTGDAEDIIEYEMIDAGYDIQADLLKIGHHGSNTSTSEAFLDAVNPTYAVISVGLNNKYGHPDLETIDKLAKSNIKTYRTDISGTIVAASDGNDIQFIFTTPKPTPTTSPEEASEPTPVPTISPSKTPIATPTPTVEPTPDPEPIPTLSVTPAAEPTPVETTKPKTQIVYKTKTGEKYHRDGCQYLSKSKIEISLGEALKQGLGPCSKCNPPR